MGKRFFIAGAFILSLGLFISGCGQGPTLKTVNAEKKSSALNFTKTDSDPSYNDKEHYVAASEGVNLADSDITVEAWIMTTITNANILERSFGAGSTTRVFLTLENGKAKGFSAVSSNTPINDNTWHHIATVLSGEGHNHPQSSSCTLATMANSHADIYIDGVFEACASASTFNSDIDNCKGSVLVDNECKVKDKPCSIVIGYNADGIIIDELRLWKTARDKSANPIDTGENLIKKCKGQELGLGNGNCDVASPGLVGYWKFNEGTGASVNDHSGIGNSGAKVRVKKKDTECNETVEKTDPWVDSWVEGNWKQ